MLCKNENSARPRASEEERKTVREVYIYIYRYTSEARRRALARCGAWLRGGCPRLRFVGNARSITRALSYLSLLVLSFPLAARARGARKGEASRGSLLPPKAHRERSGRAEPGYCARLLFFSVSLSVCVYVYICMRGPCSLVCLTFAFSLQAFPLSLSLVSVADAADERRRGREWVEIIIRIVSRFFVVDNVARKEREESLKKMGG